MRFRFRLVGRITFVYWGSEKISESENENKDYCCSWDSMNSGSPGDAVEAAAAKEES